MGRHRQYSCPVKDCHSQFEKPAHLRRHIDAVHEDNRPFQCSECTWTFTRLDSLNRHFQRRHTNALNENTNVSQSIVSLDTTTNVLLPDTTKESSFPSFPSFSNQIDHSGPSNVPDISSTGQTSSNSCIDEVMQYMLIQSLAYLTGSNSLPTIQFGPTANSEVNLDSSHIRAFGQLQYQFPASTESALQGTANQTQILLDRTMNLPFVPAHVDAEELIWLAKKRLFLLAEVLWQKSLEELMKHPTLFTILLAIGAQEHVDEEIRKFAYGLWSFSYTSTWVLASITMDDETRIAPSMLVALFSHYFAFTADDNRCFRKAWHGWQTCRSVCQEPYWRSVKDDDNVSKEPQSESMEEWQKWQEKEQINRTAICLVILDSQSIFDNLCYSSSYKSTIQTGYQNILGTNGSIFRVLLECSEPCSNEIWNADSLETFTRAKCSETSLNGFGDMLSKLHCCTQSVELETIFSRSIQKLTLLALLEGLHLARLDAQIEIPLKINQFENGIRNWLFILQRSLHHDDLHLLLRWHAIQCEGLLEISTVANAVQRGNQAFQELFSSLTIETQFRILYHSGAILSISLEQKTMTNMPMFIGRSVCFALANITIIALNSNNKGIIQSNEYANKKDLMDRKTYIDHFCPFDNNFIPLLYGSIFDQSIQLKHALKHLIADIRSLGRPPWHGAKLMQEAIVRLIVN